MSTTSRFLLTLLLTIMAVYALSLKMPPDVLAGFSVNISAAGYTIETSLLLLTATIILLVLCMRLLRWVVNLPCKHLYARASAKHDRLLQSMADCWIRLLSGELYDAEKSIKELAKNNKPVMLLQAVLCEESAQVAEALRIYERLAFDNAVQKHERLIAIRRALNMHASWRDNTRVSELLSAAEQLTQKQWVLRNRFDFYIQNKAWHQALSIIEYSRFSRQQKLTTPEDLRVKALLYCIIANDYKVMGNDSDAEKYWARAIKLAGNDHLDICVIHCDFLERQGRLSLNYLNGAFAAFPDSWAIARKYFNLELNEKDRLHIARFLNDMSVTNVSNKHYRDIILIFVNAEESMDNIMTLVLHDDFRGSSMINAHIAICAEAMVQSNRQIEFFDCIKKLDSVLVCERCMNTSHKFTAECEYCGRIGAKRVIT